MRSRKKLVVGNETTAFRSGRLKYLVFTAVTAALLSISFSNPAIAAKKPKKTALKKRKVNRKSTFNNFDNANLSIDVPNYEMQGHYRFIKIYDESGHTLFLGQVSPNEVFSIPVHKLKTDSILTIELFSESALDSPQIITTEING